MSLQIADTALHLDGTPYVFAKVKISYSVHDPQVQIGSVWRVLEGTEQDVSTLSDGTYSVTLYTPAEMRGAPSTTTCTIGLPDGSKVTGVVPAVAGPLVIADLLTTYAGTPWNWTLQAI